MKVKIISTLGPSSLNKNYLKLTRGIIDIYRLNLSHLTINELRKNLAFLKKNKIKNICLDTEGAQIRTYDCKTKFLKKNSKVNICINKNQKIKNSICLNPKFEISKIKKGTKIFLGFENLVIKVIKNNNFYLTCLVISSGKLEKNKGVHIDDEIKLDYLSQKDLTAIKLAKKFNVRIFALSFSNFPEDVLNFRKLIKKKDFLISKIETANAVKNFRKISDLSNATLIDRGDLSRYIDIIKIPKIQDRILSISKKTKKPVYIATNLLETMTSKPLPTRAESNDIYHSLKSGAKGLVLAAETAIGKYPVECVHFIRNFIFQYKKNFK